MATSAAVLWQSEDQTVTLLDIPRSISAAQGNEEYPCTGRLLTCHAMQSPYATNEPKSAAAKAKLQVNTVEEELHQGYEIRLQQALNDVRRHHNGDWCLPRSFISNHDERAPKKRKSSHGTSLQAEHESQRTFADVTRPAEVVTTNPVAHLTCVDCDDYDGQFHSNCSFTPLVSSIGRTKEDDGQPPLLYRLPPRSSFCLSDCNDSISFHTNVRNQAQIHDTRRHFDCILLDPPWPNRSVKRSHKTPGITYPTSTTLEDIERLILNTDLEMLMTNGCLVGFWITNKPAIREILLGEDGIFSAWSLELEEEWVWLKTTAHGDPVTPLDSMWRKPYEVLLLARKRTTLRIAPWANGGAIPTRRVIIGTPDLHSRKPCLKELIEHILPRECRVLEVFARHLVAGWWSWGNECLRFNETSNWSRPDHNEQFDEEQNNQAGL